MLSNCTKASICTPLKSSEDFIQHYEVLLALQQPDRQLKIFIMEKRESCCALTEFTQFMCIFCLSASDGFET